MGLLELAWMATDLPDGCRAQEVVCLSKDSLLACRAGDVSEADFQSRWNVACLEAVAVGDL